jgi:hypothetical protein
MLRAPLSAPPGPAVLPSPSPRVAADAVGSKAFVPAGAPASQAAAPSEQMTFEEETIFLERILRSFGKLKRSYKGKQRLLGFQKGRLFDEDGMFAFDGSIKSVAIDVGAANNPLTFDLGLDATQIVFMFEALPGHSEALQTAFEQDINGAWRRGGCNTRWDAVCMSDRFVWWRAAVAPKVGFTSFVLSDSPYCGSLGEFTEKSGPSIDAKLAKHPEMNGWLKACYNTKSKTVKVYAVTLASIIRRIPQNIRVKYLKIDAQGHDFKVFMTAGEYISRIDYVRFEMQVDPPPNRKMVKDVPSYAEVVQVMKDHGFTFQGKHACDDSSMAAFSKAIREMECTFCRKKPCIEGGKPPLGVSPGEVVHRKGSWSSLVTNPGPGATASTRSIPSNNARRLEGEPTNFEEETAFLEKILRSFGKLKPGYSGKQRLLGFQKGRLFDDDGMFAFDKSVKSVAIDVGAANNPLTFDLGIDASQVVFMFEALPGHSDGLEKAFEKDNQALQQRGGCDTQWDGFCQQDRFLWFRSAVSPKVGYTDFVISSNPYCGSLGGFTDKKGSEMDATLVRNPEMNHWLQACYNTESRSVKVFTVTLESIIKRIPKNIRVKYMKIDAQGHDFKVLMTAGDQISRIDYVRFEMQVDPPPNRKMVKDVPSYEEVVRWMEGKGLVHEGSHACDDSTMANFSKAIKEMECVFCREPPCQEGGKPPLGESPAEVLRREGGWKEFGEQG